MNELIVDASLDKLDEVLEFVEGAMGALPPKACMQLNIAVEEIFVNIASYAYAPEKGSVRIRAEEAPDGTIVVFLDGGVPYNPLEHRDPDITLPAEQREIGGLGLLMAKKMTDEITYRYENGMNILTVKKAAPDGGVK
ncbi:MAG: ATP-binding protein [Oscillospiraceae bacterium]|jgi:anti-sigma regulatory factor (Ser/Thr protein kinase)|nr:ATP-binding protein [Oscillospiraceae bacterium]